MEASPYRAMVERTGSSEATSDFAHPTLKQDRNARIVIAGHAFIQNVRRGHYALAVEAPANRRVAVAFDEFALAI